MGHEAVVVAFTQLIGMIRDLSIWMNDLGPVSVTLYKELAIVK